MSFLEIRSRWVSITLFTSNLLGSWQLFSRRLIYVWKIASVRSAGVSACAILKVQLEQTAVLESYNYLVILHVYGGFVSFRHVWVLLQCMFLTLFQCVKRYRNAHTLLHSLAQMADLAHDRQLLNSYKSEVEKRLIYLEAQGYCIALSWAKLAM